MTEPQLAVPVYIAGVGARTAVGDTANISMASLRAGISRVRETAYRSLHGPWVWGAPIDGLDAPSLGLPYLTALAAPALCECLESVPIAPDEDVALLLGVRDERNAQPGPSTGELVPALESALSRVFHPQSAVFRKGGVAFVSALAAAAQLLASRQVRYCVVGGVDSYLTLRDIRELEAADRLKSPRNSEGVTPGEAACFVALTAADAQSDVVVAGIGEAHEPGSDPQAPNRGEGFEKSLRAALEQAGIPSRRVGFRMTDASGERGGFLESGLAAMRLYREEMPLPSQWLLSGSLGSVGAAAGPLLVGWAAAALRGGYAPGDMATCELTGERGDRGALLVRGSLRGAT